MNNKINILKNKTNEHCVNFYVHYILATYKNQAVPFTRSVLLLP